MGEEPGDQRPLVFWKFRFGSVGPKFSSGSTMMRLIRKQTIRRIHNAYTPYFFNLFFEKGDPFFFLSLRILFRMRPLLGEIEYSPEASLSIVS
jgi:hypothetical protein